MILLCGIPSETPLAMVAAELERVGAPYAFFNQRQAAYASLTWEIETGTARGVLDLGNQRVRLEEVIGVYTRLMDDRMLPEIEAEPEGSAARCRCRALHDALCRWCEISPARVVNRAQAQLSNGSKPYQAQLIAQHEFSVPETLITNDPDLVRCFFLTHGKVIYKSMSGVRSIVRLLCEDDLTRLEAIRWCPVQFQAFVPGTDVRVHTIGDEAFATEVASDVVDYRYAHQSGGEAALRAVDLPDEVVGGCLRLAQDLNLAFAGIDLRITPEGRVFCFEVNPSPAFSYFERNTGQPIARAVARYLAGTR
jgi:glutathione synthase/RimK-type ligase-like ATP-grasp enzyme